MEPKRKMLVQRGELFFEIRRGSGIVDDDGKPVRYCPDCSAQYTDADIYHPVASSTYNR